MSPVVVSRPIAGVAPASVSHRLWSGPTMICPDWLWLALSSPTENSVTVPAGVQRPRAAVAP